MPRAKSRLPIEQLYARPPRHGRKRALTERAHHRETAMKADVEDARSLNRRHLPRIGLASNERSHFQLRQTISATIDRRLNEKNHNV